MKPARVNVAQAIAMTAIHAATVTSLVTFFRLMLDLCNGVGSVASE